ncbi:hypothetical protein C942_04218 [Photobacterium marinum]|uniref:Uncharacterized protein n=1 Tax=Photobacterium marinum TaxID=1056511 RepID=L8JCE9_9GAMM|nr:hypothetical protein [Photobacterium marinum]ELR66520.1 hypothetical protein C942_04218 [Photobacterium marinum]
MQIEQLYSAYLGELYGIAFFTAFAEKYSNNSHANKWQKLIQIEQITAQRLKSGLEPLGKTCPDLHPEMELKGLCDAEKWLHLEWSELVDTMAPWVEPYALKYREQAQQASEHEALFTLVQEHEDAIWAFLKAEQKGDNNSTAILDHFINRYGTP